MGALSRLSWGDKEVWSRLGEAALAQVWGRVCEGQAGGSHYRPGVGGLHGCCHQVSWLRCPDVSWAGL